VYVRERERERERERKREERERKYGVSERFAFFLRKPIITKKTWICKKLIIFLGGFDTYTGGYRLRVFIERDKNGYYLFRYTYLFYIESRDFPASAQ